MSNEQIILQSDTKIKSELPNLWKVIFINDNYTPMEFVIEMLVKIFKHSEDSAKNITLEIHNTGSAVAGIYPFEIAEQKSLETTQLSRENGFPLQITVEEE